MEILFKLLMCHFVGDYVLQNDFIANTKGTNWWHLIVHSFLYSLPFYVVFGFCWKIGVILVSHIIIDALKARWKKISYSEDQVLHLVIMLVYMMIR